MLRIFRLSSLLKRRMKFIPRPVAAGATRATLSVFCLRCSETALAWNSVKRGNKAYRKYRCGKPKRYRPAGVPIDDPFARRQASATLVVENPVSATKTPYWVTAKGVTDPKWCLSPREAARTHIPWIVPRVSVVHELSLVPFC
jgi:hypothetical protein